MPSHIPITHLLFSLVPSPVPSLHSYLEVKSKHHIISPVNHITIITCPPKINKNDKFLNVFKTQRLFPFPQNEGF